MLGHRKKLIAAAIAGVAASSQAALTITPTIGGTNLADYSNTVGSSANVPLTAAGVQTINVYATVTGAAVGLEGLQTISGSWLTTNNVGDGAGEGNVTSARVGPFNGSSSADGFGSDLDGDGDLDLGNLGTAIIAGTTVTQPLVSYRSGSSTGGNPDGTTASVFRVGTLSWNVGSLAGTPSPGNELTTVVNFDKAGTTNNTASASFTQDGGLLNGSSGTLVLNTLTFYRPYATAVDGGGVPGYTINENDPLNLLGSGQQSTFAAGAATFAWDLDNDGSFDDFFSASGAVSYGTLSGLGVGPGVTTIRLRTTASDGASSIDATTLTIVPVPEPTSLALIGLGALGMVRRRRA